MICNVNRGKNLPMDMAVLYLLKVLNYWKLLQMRFCSSTNGEFTFFLRGRFNKIMFIVPSCLKPPNLQNPKNADRRFLLHAWLYLQCWACVKLLLSFSLGRGEIIFLMNGLTWYGNWRWMLEASCDAWADRTGRTLPVLTWWCQPTAALAHTLVHLRIYAMGVPEALWRFEALS